jgi:poly(beta-D-mannuronate) lyase
VPFYHAALFRWRMLIAMPRAVALLLLSLVGLCCSAIGATPACADGFVVRDPDASFVDLAARRHELGPRGLDTLRQALPPPPPCGPDARPAPPTGRMRLPRYYLNVMYGPVDPTYEAAEQPYAALWSAVSLRASRYAAFGEAADARCVLDVLDDWARAGALLDYSRRESPQAWYMVEWAASASGLAFSVIRGEPSLPPERRVAVIAWLVQVATKQIGEPSDPISCCNNHAAWRGLMAAAIGVVAQDDALFDYGVHRFLRMLDQIAPDGSLPLEMIRRERALHYQNYAILPMIGIAELALRQGYDVYAARSGSGRGLQDAVRFLLAGLADPAPVAQFAGAPQELRYLRPAHRDLAWMEAYRRRFPSPSFDRHLPTAPFEPLLGGSSAVYWRLDPGG